MYFHGTEGLRVMTVSGYASHLTGKAYLTLKIKAGAMHLVTV